MRSESEIKKYLDESFDKVWFMRSCPSEIPHIESKRQDKIKEILKQYQDIPPEGYTDWECGYWNGILGALRWVLGDEKNFLDT